MADVAAVPKMGLLGTIGLLIGVGGTGATAIASLKGVLGSGDAQGNLIRSPATYVATAGLGFAMFAASSPFRNPVVQRIAIGGALAALAGGALGMAGATIPTYSDPKNLAGTHGARSGAVDVAEGAATIARTTPHAPADLAGLDVAGAEILTTAGDRIDVPIYVDPKQATRLKTTDLATAVATARRAAQAAPKNTAEAVIQTADGALWEMPTAGKADQLDGRWYGEDNDYDSTRTPTIERTDSSLRALVGVDHAWQFAATTGGTR